jgi:hypothetical protein
MFAWLSIGGVVIVAVLAWNLMRRFAADGVGRFKDSRRASSRFVSSAEFIDGSRHLPISLALNDLALYYENADMQASLDLDWIQEVEYENELVTGQHIGHGKVLRLRCFSQVFEFIIPSDAVQQWQGVLPARRTRAAVADSVSELGRAADDGWPAVAAQ